ncbi:MAG TPA: APC family permease [Actinomycetota bacterium]|nr:APC family permease [Actinomycetota bacterium]
MATEMDKMTGDTGYERLGRRRLKLVDVVAQSVGLIGPVFSAAFLIPLIAGFNFSGEGAGIATPFAVILAAIGVLALGWIVAQYAKRVHAAGSLYDYVTMGFGSRVGGWAGWIYYGGTLLLSSAIAVLVGWFLRDNVLPAFEIDPIMPSWAWSLIYVGIVFLILAAGVQISTRVQLLLALVSVVVVLAFFINVIVNAPENSLKAFNPAEAPNYTGILFGVLYGVLIFVGFETAANLAEEAEAPKRAIPRAVLLSVAIVSVFYVIAAYAQVAGFGFDVAVLTSPEVAAAPLFALGSPDAAGGYGGSSDLMLKVLLVVVLLDVMAVGLGAATATTRGLFALARDRKIPGVLAATTGGGNPVAAALVVAVVSAAWVLSTVAFDTLFTNGALATAPHELGVFQWISTLGAFLIMVVYGIMALGAFFGLSDHPNKVGLVVSGVLGILVAAGAIFGAIYKVAPPFDRIWVWGVIWAALGLVVTLALKGREPARRALADLSTAEEG